MQRALQARVVPHLRERGFRGSFPHFRRVGTVQTDLLTFQFNKWGRSFIIELGRAAAGRYQNAMGEIIPSTELSAWNLALADRARLHAGRWARREVWFKFGPSLRWWRNPRRFDRAADHVVALLPQADAWWSGALEPQGILRYSSA
jgi:hypothetical protein